MASPNRQVDLPTEVRVRGVLLITGGTGSFGHAVLSRFLNSGIDEIRIFSRDEKKQDDMRKRYANPKLKFYIGDVRDRHSLRTAFRGVDQWRQDGWQEPHSLERELSGTKWAQHGYLSDRSE